MIFTKRWRKNISRALKYKYKNDPKFRELVKSNGFKTWSNPETVKKLKKKHSNTLKKLWADKGYKEKNLKIWHRPMSQEIKDKKRDNWLGDKNPAKRLDIRKKISNKLKGRKNTWIRKGDKCNFWKGGITKLESKIRGSIEYRIWRSDIFTKNNFTCQECGQIGKSIQAHHINSLSNIINKYNIKILEDAINCEELWDINNGETLCINCHKKTDSYLKNRTNS